MNGEQFPFRILEDIDEIEKLVAGRLNGFDSRTLDLA